MKHYKGKEIEPIEIIEEYELNFNLGNVIKYVLRAGRKEGVEGAKDLEKALDYIHREVYGEWHNFNKGNQTMLIKEVERKKPVY